MAGAARSHSAGAPSHTIRTSSRNAATYAETSSNDVARGSPLAANQAAAPLPLLVTVGRFLSLPLLRPFAP